MVKGLFTLVAGVLLLATFFMLAVRILFTEPSAHLFNFHPVAVQFVNGEITEQQLDKTYIKTQYGTFKFTPLEISHFADVKKIIHHINKGVIAGLIFMLFIYLTSKKFTYSASKWGLILSIILVVSSALFLATGHWKPLTSFLHNIAFPNGNWRFHAGSLTIQLYPRILMQFSFIGCFFFAFIMLFGLNFCTRQK